MDAKVKYFLLTLLVAFLMASSSSSAHAQSCDEIIGEMKQAPIAAVVIKGDNWCRGMQLVRLVQEIEQSVLKDCRAHATNCSVAFAKSMLDKEPDRYVCNQALSFDRTRWWWGTSSSDSDGKFETDRRGLTVEKCRALLGIQNTPPNNSIAASGDQKKPDVPVVAPPSEPLPQPKVVVAVPSSEPAPSPKVLSERVALVIGNSAYQNANMLPNPKNDAAAIATKLRTLGFQVIEAEDLDKPSMDQTVRRFESSLDGAKVALLFYAGHGIQYQGRNYLIPIDAKLQDPTAIDFELVSVDQVLDKMSDPNRTSIVMLDSCRNNPLARNFVSKISRSVGAQEGLANSNISPTGMMIAFATAPDQTALDGDGEHSPFTKALLDHLDEKVEVSLMFKRVRQEVMNITKNGQQPWENSSIGEFYMNP